MTRPTISMVVTTYNWPEALGAVLRSIAAQRILPGEVIVADDGSGEATRQAILAQRARFPVPLHHAWQPDDGFRAGQIRNKAVALATGAYVLQIDGDMVLHPDFVRDHAAAATPGYFVGGSRVILGPEATSGVIAGQLATGFFTPGVRNRFNGVRLPRLGRALARLGPVRSLRSARGANFAFWREDFVAVNGYDEAYVGWGREDTDLVVRLQLHGLKRRFFKLQGIAYHLHHREQSRERLGANDELLRRAGAGGAWRCDKGIDQYLGPAAARALRD